MFADSGKRDIQVFCPAGAGGRIHTPGIADARGVFKCMRKTGRKFPFFKRQVPSHGNNKIGNRDSCRADLSAGITGRAVPKTGFRHQTVD